MRDYEVVYIFRPELESDDVDDRLEAFHDRLEGEVTALEHWGQRELAYEIEGERRGYYAVAQFRAEPSSLLDFEQALELEEDLVRHLLVVSEGEMPLPPSQRQEDEEEEDEEKEDEDEGDETEADDADDEDEGEGEGEDGAGAGGDDDGGEPEEEEADEEAADDERAGDEGDDGPDEGSADESDDDEEQ